jgi:hypothetical protein
MFGDGVTEPFRIEWYATQIDTSSTSTQPDTGQVPPGLYQIKPGTSLSGFSFKDPRPPGSVKFYLAAYVPITTVPTEQDAENLADTCPASGTFTDVAVTGATQGPVMPVLSASIAGQSVASPGVVALSIKFTNTGTGVAQNINVNQISFRTLAGTGTVTYDVAVSPTLPVLIPTLAPGASSTVQMFASVPSSVTRFSMVENGTLQDTAANTYNFSLSQAIVP